MNQKISILLINETDGINLSLKGFILKSFKDVDVIDTTKGNDVWEKINNFMPDIILSSDSFSGFNGFQLCKLMKESEKFSDIIFLFFSTNNAKEHKIRLFKLGADDYIERGLPLEEFYAKMNMAVRLAKLKKELKAKEDIAGSLKEEMKRSTNNLIQLGISLIKVRIPSSNEILTRTSAAAAWLAEQLGEMTEEEIEDVRVAAALCYAGKLFLPDELINTPVILDGKPTHELMYQIPVMAKTILSKHPSLERASNLIEHIYENLDGSGFPDRLQAWQIPLGSRIIRSVLDFEESIILQRNSPNDAFEELHKQEKRIYDHKFVTLLEQYFESYRKNQKYADFRAIQLQELKEGMFLGKDIITNSGMKLVAAGTVLSERIIQTIITHNTTDAIIGNIYVR